MCVITGETGSGKSTQLPQYIYDCEKIKKHISDCSKKKIDQLKICVTQPRRVAAISMAKRISYERARKLGNEISYAIRFDDRTSDGTCLRYITDGILVRECINVRYSTNC